MLDEYLWDRTGDPDPEVEKLENLLAGYRSSPRQSSSTRNLRRYLAVAASLILIASCVFWLNRKPVSEWQLAGKRLSIGQTVETNGYSRAKLLAQSVGEVLLEPNSRLRIVASSGEGQQLALRHGTLHATIWAPPSRFVVDTPSAKTIDLGCSYTLSVFNDDSGLLTVQTGWVAFQAGLLESFIPAGAACRTHPRLGPGLPYFENASKPFRDAVADFDTTATRQALSAVISSARKEDALTLWHLIVRTSGRNRDLAVLAFSALVPQADASGLRAGDAHAIDQAWNLLGLGGTDWWRMWKHNWQP